jgi:hypothetical protein
MIIRPILQLIWIYGWRLDHLVEWIEIRFTISQILQLRIYGRVIVYWPLVLQNWVQALNLWSSRWLYNYKFKLLQPDLVLRQNDLVLRWPKLGDCIWSYCYTWVIHVVNPICPLVPMKICLLLQLMSSKWTIFKLIFGFLFEFFSSLFIWIFLKKN